MLAMGVHSLLGFSTRRSLILFSCVTVVAVTIISTWLGDLASRGSLWILQHDQFTIPHYDRRRVLAPDRTLGQFSNPAMTRPVTSSIPSRSSAALRFGLGVKRSPTLTTTARQFLNAFSQLQTEPVPLTIHSSERFLLPVLPFGPNNQFRAFREAIVLALWLNRTIVLPPFFKHYTSRNNQQEPELTQAEDIFDVVKLRGLLPVVTGKDFSRLCAEKLDVLFQVRVPTYPSQFQRIIKLFTLLKLKENDYLSTRRIRQPRQSPANDVIRVPSQKVALDVFPSKLRCAAVLFPFKAVDISRHLVPLALHLQHSKRLKDLASHFVTLVMEGQPYMAVHWRYNSDWASTWCQQGVGNRYNEALVKDSHNHGACRVLGIEDERVTTSVQLLAKKYKMAYVYVATPLAERSPLMKLLRSSIPSLLSSKELLQLIGEESQDLGDSGLKPIKNNFDLSLVEQELCLGASVFVGSHKSTWSENVAFERLGLKHRTREIVEPVLWIDKVLFPH